ncbi:hypothetical protein BJ944DRAFT_268658 [Cunninghamella echinulata]|nr:hypothetical protein BJ944DRAFT_268658 [Cunninghamella echinulata]
MNTPYNLQTTSINPANLMELQVLSQVVADKQGKNDIKGSIPYLAKMTQIIDHQQIPKQNGNNKNNNISDKNNNDNSNSNNNNPQSNKKEQQRILFSLQADAYKQLGDAYLKTGQYIQAEASFTMSTKRLELLCKKNDVRPNNETRLELMELYDKLIQCYQYMNKPHMVRGIEDRKLKYLPS